MRVSDVMTQPAVTCLPNTSIAMAAYVMNHHGCGILPVVDNNRRLVGVVTDRDLLLAAAGARERRAAGEVRGAMTVDVASCMPDDDLTAALATMRSSAVRRLPVIDAARHVIGLLSIDDVMRWAVRRDGISANEAVQTFDEICEGQAAPVRLTRATE
jgi:CBS domain-containing protein